MKISIYKSACVWVSVCAVHTQPVYVLFEKVIVERIVNTTCYACVNCHLFIIIYAKCLAVHL